MWAVDALCSVALCSVLSSSVGPRGPRRTVPVRSRTRGSPGWCPCLVSLVELVERSRGHSEGARLCLDEQSLLRSGCAAARAPSSSTPAEAASSPARAASRRAGRAATPDKQMLRYRILEYLIRFKASSYITAILWSSSLFPVCKVIV